MSRGKNTAFVVMRDAVLAFALVGFLGCGETPTPLDPSKIGLGSSAAEGDREILHESFDFTQHNICLGEDVHWTGDIQVINSFVNNRGCCDPGTYQHLHQYSTLRLEGEGLDTGATYLLSGRGVPRDDFFCPAFGLPTPCVLDFGFESPSPVDPFPVAGRPAGASQTIRSPGTGVVAEALYQSLFVINGTGDLVLFEETRENIECFVVPPAVTLPFTV